MFEIVLITFIIISLAEIIKRARLMRPRHIPLFAVVCGVLLVAGYGAANVSIYIGVNIGTHAAVSGSLIGLLSCGLYSFAKSVASLIRF